MDSEHPTLSTQWLSGIQRMDADSWSRLVSAFGPIVFRWCRKSGVPEADAADIVQEVFVSLARGAWRFERQKEIGSFRSWLATITRSRVTDFFRRQAKTQAAVGGSDALQWMQQQAEHVDSSVSLDGIGKALAQRLLVVVQSEFEPATWQAFWQTTIDGRAVSAVAESLGMSASSVYQAKSRVLRRLRQRVSELPE